MPALAADYTDGTGTAGSYFAYDRHNIGDQQAAAAVAADRPHDRSVLADVLAEQNAAWDNDGAGVQAHIDALRDPETIAVVTGQQVGLFGGSLYTIYKTSTALAWAQHLAETTGRTVVPVFWIEGEDHDFQEIAQTHVLHRNNVVTLNYAPDPAPAGPVGPHALGDAIRAPLNALDEALPPSDFKPGVYGAVKDAYTSERTLEDAFARLISTWFADTGLVLLNPDARRLKQLVRPLIAHDMDYSAQAIEAVRAAGEALQANGYHMQVQARPTNFFWMEDDGRYAIDANDDGTYTLRHDGRTWSRDELQRRIEETPERFSPNVVTRPLVQDQLLPTAAYVAGPGEISYFAQYRGVYEWAGTTMPLIVPRASMTLVESKVQKVLNKYDLSVRDVEQQTAEQLFQSVVIDAMDVNIDKAFGQTASRIHKALNDLKPTAEAVDATLGRSVEATRASVVNEMNDLKQRVVRAEKRQQDEVRAQIEKACVNLMPTRNLQERTLNPTYFFNKYSMDLLDTIRAHIDTSNASHRLVQL
jgi:bacillithiol biosynthesis cysteine-adding enzyme BshC